MTIAVDWAGKPQHKQTKTCTTTESSKLLTAIKYHVIKYYEKAYERSDKICS